MEYAIYIGQHFDEDSYVVMWVGGFDNDSRYNLNLLITYKHDKTVAWF